MSSVRWSLECIYTVVCMYICTYYVRVVLGNGHAKWRDIETEMGAGLEAEKHGFCAIWRLQLDRSQSPFHVIPTTVCTGVLNEMIDFPMNIV